MRLDLTNLHPGLKALIGIIPVIIIGLPFFFFIYQPKTDEIKKLTNEVKKLDEEIDKARKKATLLEGIDAKLKKAQKRLVEVARLLPEEHEISDLLKQVSDRAIQSGLRITSWTPGQKAPDPSNRFYEIRFTGSLEGTYHRFAAFLGKLTQLDRIVNITNFNIKPMPAKPDLIVEMGIRAEEQTIIINFEGKTFSSIPESLPPEGAKK